MGLYDYLLILSWLVVVVALCVGATVVLEADWGEVRRRLGAALRRWG